MKDEELIRILKSYGDLCIDKRNIPNVEGGMSFTMTATLYGDEGNPTTWVHTAYGDETCNAVADLYDAVRFDMWVEIDNL